MQFHEHVWCITVKHRILAPCVGRRSLLGRLCGGITDGFNDDFVLSGTGGQLPLYGRVLLGGLITISTVAQLPRRWYRVVSNQSYRGGLQARGREQGCSKALTNIDFQIRIENHFNWRSRHPSTFLSVTDDLGRAFRLSEALVKAGHKDVEILEIDPAHPQWDYDVQLI